MAKTTEKMKAYQKEYREANKSAIKVRREKDKERAKIYREINKEKTKAYNKLYGKNKKEKFRGNRLKRVYGITLEEYNKMFNEQNGCCAICKEHQSTFVQTLAVDHCHDTGEVRGLLCTNCNQMLGKAKDSTETLLQAIEYLKTSKQKK